MMGGMQKKLDDFLQENVRSGRPIFEPNLFKVDDDIVITLHNNDALETITKKIELNIGIIQLLKLMGQFFFRLTPVTLQQGVSWEPIWDVSENPTFWYHEGMLPSLAVLKSNLNQI
jgi:hypothetical protein